MQQMTGVAVLTTHLAQTDRRALSQAWYDALHLAHNLPVQRSAPMRAYDPPAPLVRGTSAPGSARLHGALPSVHERREGDARRGAVPYGQERRAPRCELAERIELALTRRVRRAVPASFAVQVAGGRVRILVRGEGTRTRVLAVCAPPLRDRVERALAQARFALAARGIRAEAG
jgi:hypothetical protein